MANSNNDFVPGSGFSIDQLSARGNNKKLLVLFLVDATRSMEGQAISQVNLAIQELISELRQFGSDNALDIKLGIMSFTNSPRWEMQAVDIQCCTNPPKIGTRPGLTCYGVIYHELNKVLQKGELIEQGGKKAPPVLVLLTDGAPNDQYQHDLEVLEKNKYFSSATRSAVIMGEAAEDPGARSAVEQFVSKENMILTTSNQTTIFSNIVLATMRTIRGEDMGDDQTTGNGQTPFPEPTDPPFPGPTDLPLPVPTDPPLPGPSDLPFPGPTDPPFPGPSDPPFPGPSDPPFPGPSDPPFPGPSDLPLPGQTDSPSPGPSNPPSPGPTDLPLPGPTDPPFPGPSDPPFFDTDFDIGKDTTDQTPPQDLTFQFPSVDPADQPVSIDSDPGSLDLTSLDKLL